MVLLLLPLLRQVASGFLVEVGNKEQDKFVFDLGSGSFTNLLATGVDFAKLTKVHEKTVARQCWDPTLMSNNFLAVFRHEQVGMYLHWK